MAQTQISCIQGELSICTYKGDTMGTPTGNGIKFTVYTDENKTERYDLSGNTILCQVKKKAANRTFRMEFDSENPNGTSIDMTNADQGEFILNMTAEYAKNTPAFPKNPDEDDPYVFDIEIASDRIEIVTQLDISAADTTNIFNRVAGDWLADGFTKATKVKVSGFTDDANNGIFDVVSITANDIEVSQTLVTEAAGSSITVEMLAPETREIFTYISGNWQHSQDVTGVTL